MFIELWKNIDIIPRQFDPVEIKKKFCYLILLMR